MGGDKKYRKNSLVKKKNKKKPITKNTQEMHQIIINKLNQLLEYAQPIWKNIINKIVVEQKKREKKLFEVELEAEM